MAAETPLVSSGDEYQPDSISPSSRTSNTSYLNDGGDFRVYVEVYFITLAMILGSGILGLPVALSQSGFEPFLVTFIPGALVQIILVIFFVEILQRAHALQLYNEQESGNTEHLALQSLSQYDGSEDSRSSDEYHDVPDNELFSESPVTSSVNLHLLGDLFLSCIWRQWFNIVVIFHFMIALLSYTLAGSEAYADAIGIKHIYVIPVFLWALAVAVIFGLRFIRPMVVLLTLFKGSFLIATVAVTLFIGTHVQREINNNFDKIEDTFLMGTVALAGVMNVMPFLYVKIKPIPKQVSRFRMAVILGILTCALLNILWALAVLEIVPQTNQCLSPSSNNSYIGLTSTIANEQVCEDVSLEKARDEGHISTIPLTKILHENYSRYDWITIIIELFIIISITVSFLVQASAMHHTLNGWVDSLWTMEKFSGYTEKMELINSYSKESCINAKSVTKCCVSIFIFLIIFILAMTNPKGFVMILEKGLSLLANIEAGVFVFLMLNSALNEDNKQLSIPVPLPSWFIHLKWIFLFYFLFAIGYDVYSSLKQLIIEPAINSYTHQGNETSLGFDPNVLG